MGQQGHVFCGNNISRDGVFSVSRTSVEVGIKKLIRLLINAFLFVLGYILINGLFCYCDFRESSSSDLNETASCI